MRNKTAQPHKAGAFEKRVGNTVYAVGVYYNENAKETARDKILRLIKNGAVGKGNPRGGEAKKL